MVWKLQINDNQQLVSLTDYDAQADDNKFQNSLVDFVRRSSCPPKDDYRKLLPWRVRFMTSQDKPDHDHDDVRNNGVDKNSRQFYVQIPFNLCSSLLLDRQTKQNQQQQLLLSEEQLPRIEAPSSLQRVILAIHGYGGRPLQELQKWHESVTLDDTIIIAPQGSPTQTSNGNQKLGWNARDCCGDPVLNDLEDVEFVVHGVVEVFSEALNILISARNHDENSTSRRDNNNVSERNVNIQVIATGFSNGGFFTSLLGLLPSQSRPEWLVGIVPTGGYQYDIGLYNGKHYYEDKIRDVDGGSEGRVPDPLPILMHHGGRDSVVKPEGCCNVVSDLVKNSGIEKSNCVFDIGIHQPTCTSVQSAFEKWVELNHCESGFGSVGGISSTTAPGVDIVDMMIEEKVVHHNGSYDGVDPQNTLVNPSKNHGSHASGHSKNNNESNMEELNSNNQLTCQKGNRCRVPTGFCIWENEGHSWGGKFPGVDMTRVWMDRVFDEAEHHGITAQGNQQLDHVSMETISSNIMGRTMFSEFVLILTFLAAVLVVSSIFCLRGGIKRWSPCKILCYKRAKRKCSEEFVLDGDDVESAQIERGSILEGNK